jgi:hypothetical protein
MVAKMMLADQASKRAVNGGGRNPRATTQGSPAAPASVGINAPPMTFEVGGKQYVAIVTGLGLPAKSALVNTPELREMRNQTMLFVFGL